MKQLKVSSHVSQQGAMAHEQLDPNAEAFVIVGDDCELKDQSAIDWLYLYILGLAHQTEK